MKPMMPMQPMMQDAPRRLARSALAALAALAAPLGACGASDLSGNPGDGGLTDAGTGCSVFITFEPDTPIAGPATLVRANAMALNAPGVLTYAWSVSHAGIDLSTTPAQADGSAIIFPAASAGVYTVRVDVGGSAHCPTQQVPLNVQAPGGNPSEVRLRVAPPASQPAPPLDRLVAVLGGADFSLGTVTVESGMTVTGAVRNGGAGVAAYLRFMPAAAPDAAVEAFAGVGGAFSVRVVNQLHSVLVIPAVAGLAPRLIKSWTPAQTTLNVGAGTAVSGVVRGPGGTSLQGAQVQLKIGEVPSTISTTGPTGAFTVAVEPDPGAVISIDVAPPAGSGLPRLTAQSATLFDLAQSFQVSYSAGLVLRDLAGASIRRQGAPIGGARVSLVGAVGASGTVTAGATPVTAAGVVRIAATAGGTGALPSTLAPARPLSAVVEVAPGDVAVAAIDLTAGAPSTIDAPSAVAIATVIRAPGGAALSGAVLDAVPTGALALAGVTSTIRARSGASGQVATSLAAGGRYDLRVHDPQLARGAPLQVADVSAQVIAPVHTLLPALKVSGKLVLAPTPTPVGNAAVQILCSLCAGAERSRPLAEGTSALDGTFTLAVPDPGTN